MESSKKRAQRIWCSLRDETSRRDGKSEIAEADALLHDLLVVPSLGVACGGGTYRFKPMRVSVEHGWTVRYMHKAAKERKDKYGGRRVGGSTAEGVGDSCGTAQNHHTLHTFCGEGRERGR